MFIKTGNLTSPILILYLLKSSVTGRFTTKTLCILPTDCIYVLKINSDYFLYNINQLVFLIKEHSGICEVKFLSM